MKILPRKGIVLVTTLIFLTIIFMVASSLILTSSRTLEIGSSYSHSEAAYNAALSGIDYARYRLASSGVWMAEKATDCEEQLKANRPFVVEENGWNITGYLDNDSSGTPRSKFKMTFYDGTNAPSGKDCIKYISLNNFNTKLNGYKTTLRQTKVKSAFTYGTFRDVQPDTMHVIVQGTSGNAMCYVEALLKKTGSSDIPPCSFAGGDVKAVLTGSYSAFRIDSTVEDSKQFKAGILRSGHNVSVSTLGKSAMSNLVVENSGNAKGRIHAQKLEYGGKQFLSTNKELPFDYFKTESDNDIASRLTSLEKEIGKSDYFNMSEPSSETYTLCGRFNMSDGPKYGSITLKKSSNFDPADPLKHLDTGGSRINLHDMPSYFTPKGGAEFTLNPKKDEEDATVTADNNVVLGVFEEIVHVSTDSEGNTTTTYSYRLSNRSKVTLDFQKNQNLVVENGSLEIKGSVSGSGKIYTKDDVSFQGESVFSTKPGSGVAIYSEKGDINVGSPKDTGTFLSVDVQNLLNTAWKKVLENFDEPGATSGKYTETKLESHSELKNELLKATVATETRHFLGFSRTKNISLLEKLTETMGSDKVAPLIDAIVSNNSYVGDYDATYTKLPEISTVESLREPADPESSLPGKILEITKIQIDDIYVEKKEDGTYTVSKDNGLSASNISEGILFSSNLSEILNDSNPTGMSGIFQLSSWPTPEQLENKKPTEWSNYETLQELNEERPIGQNTLIMKSQGALSMPSRGDTTIHGMLYAKDGNININGELNNVYIRGGIVAKKDISIKNAKNVTLNYDPNYMNFTLGQTVVSEPVFRSVIGR